MLDLKLKAAIDEMKIAENRFNNADKSDINLAIHELMVAEEKLNSILKDIKNKR